MKKFLDFLTKKDREEYVSKTIEDVYNKVAEETGRSPEEIAQIGGVESEHGKYNKNMANSSARGLFQIMPQIAKHYAPNEPVESLNTQEEILTKLINEYQNKVGREIPIEELYTLHNLGLGRGKRMIASEEKKPTSQVLTKKIIESNPKLYKNKTVGQSKKTIRQFLKERGEKFKFSPTFQELFKLNEEEDIENE